MEVVAKLRRAGVRALTVDSRQAAPEVAFVALPPATSASHDGRDFAQRAWCGAPIVLGQGARPRPSPTWVELSDVRKDYPGIAAELAGEWGQNVTFLGSPVQTVRPPSPGSPASCSAHSVGRLRPVGDARCSVGRCGRATRFHDAASGGAASSLARMAGDGVRWLVMEVSSHALALGRSARFGSAGMLTTLARSPRLSRRRRALPPM